MEVSLDFLPSTPPPPEIANIIRGRKTQYCELADKHHWERFTEITTADAVLEFCNSDGSYIQGSNGKPWNFKRDEFIAHCSAEFKDAQYIHMTGPGMMGYEPAANGNPATVKAVFNGIYHLGSTGEPGPFYTGGGYYHETWVEEGNQWLLKHLKFYRGFWKSSTS